jgi:hypothetical protein
MEDPQPQPHPETVSISVVRTKPGVSFAQIAPAGFRILAAIDRAACTLGFDLTVTSACDGAHSGPNDPHHRGEAYDVRSHDLSLEHKLQVLSAIMATLGGERFFGFIEDCDTENEHFHFQVKKGTAYP